MAIEITEDGFFTELCAVNQENARVFPHLKSKKGALEKGFSITLTGKQKDYHLVGLNQFIEHIAKGDFDEVGRVRMKPRNGGRSNGFAVRTATMSKALLLEIEKRNRK